MILGRAFEAPAVLVRFVRTPGCEGVALARRIRSMDLAFKGLIPDGVLDRPVDILTLVGFLQPQDVSGVEPAVSRMSLG